MPNVLVRDLPSEAHAHLVRRAAAQGMSLQRYLAAELERLATTPTLDEALDRVETRHGGSVPSWQAVEDLEHDRR